MPAITRFTNDFLQPFHPAPDAVRGVVRMPGLASWVKGQVLGYQTDPVAAQSEVHTYTFSGTPSGTFRIQWGTDVSGPITYSGTAATMIANLQAALNAMPSLGTGNAVVTGTGPYTVTFQGEAANKAIPVPGVISSLTGGTVAITEATAGSPGGGLAYPYDPAGTDGRQVAKCVNEHAVQTNLLGQIVTNRPGTMNTSTEVFTAGPFLCSELVGLDTAAVNALGRVINATVYTAPEAVIVIR